MLFKTEEQFPEPDVGMHRMIYVSGPMTGRTEHNCPAFAAAQKYLESLEWKVENPGEHGVVQGWEWWDYIIRDLHILKVCDAICMLPGYWESPGALVELFSAVRMGLHVYELVGPEYEGTLLDQELPYDDTILFGSVKTAGQS